MAELEVSMTKPVPDGNREYISINPLVEVMVGWCIANGVPYNRDWIEAWATIIQQGHNDLQSAITKWAMVCFGKEHVTNPSLRALRLVEEAIEYAQSVDCDKDKIHNLVDYVYSRDKGSPTQELGGVGITALVAASSIGVKFDDCLAAEVNRIKSTPSTKFTKRNQDKVDAGFGGKND